MDDTRQSVPAIIYAAKSTDDPHGSIPTQLADCEAMCARERLSVAESYSDEAASAYSGSRGPGLARAREHAEQLAAEHGSCALVVQHTDRLARGDGIAAAHLVEILLWGRKVGVTIRSVQDDSTGESVLMAAVMGERNFEDSKRKATATAAGKRRAAERGEWQGTVVDGYRIERSVTGASVARCVTFDPEREPVYRQIWSMAQDGATANAIVRELAAKRHLTAPYSRRGKPRPFDSARLQKVLRNPFYAGLHVHKGEVLGSGRWPHYIEPDEWERLRRERRERRRHKPNPEGRPRGGLLAGLAKCGECGDAAVHQVGNPRKDGTRKRHYICSTVKLRPGAIDGCSARPYPAELVEGTVLSHLKELLTDSSALTDAITGARAADRGRLMAQVEAAERELADAEHASTKLTAAYDAAVVADNEDELRVCRDAMAARRRAAEDAAIRQQAATGALAALDAEPEESAELALARLWQTLSGRLSAAQGDVRAMNQALREHFARFELHDGGERILPVLSIDAAIVPPLRWDGEALHVEPAGPEDIAAALDHLGGARWPIDGVPGPNYPAVGVLAEIVKLVQAHLPEWTTQIAP